MIQIIKFTKLGKKSSFGVYREGLFLIKAPLRKIQRGTFHSSFHHINIIFDESLDGIVYFTHLLIKLHQKLVCHLTEFLPPQLPLSAGRWSFYFDISGHIKPPQVYTVSTT